ncbi:MAG: type I-F CRISPR-associated protein Csy1 [Cellvibrio sp.]|nr:type I-F CRISPR-associated protein Csy1 [Cellvibrio sp.]
MINEEISQVLSEKIVEYLHNRRDDKEESFLKSKAKKNKQGKVTNGAIIERVITCLKKISSEKAHLSDIERLKKPKDQTSLEFQREKLKKLLSSVDDVTDQELMDLRSEYKAFVIENTKEHEPVNWLNQWAPKAIDISFATHVGKLTHSSSKSSSILDSTDAVNDRYLTTNRLTNLAIDTASSNAASLPIADFLSLSVDDVRVLDLIKSGDNSLFKNFTDDQSSIDRWCEYLKQAFDSDKKQGHFLSKQVYFPIGGCQYHLLMPLVSSSLVQELHLEFNRYKDESLKLAFKQKKDGKYSPVITVGYPNKSAQSITSSLKAHSNVSPLNKDRQGNITLLCTAPPKWQGRLPSYIDKSSIFTKTLTFELKEEVAELSNYLLLLKNKALSVSEPKRNAAVLSKLRAINGQLFSYLDSINEAENDDGWTSTSKLPIEQQLLFEPWRDDETAQTCKINNDWMVIVSREFGRWLNQQLNINKQLNLTPIQAALWADCFLVDLKEVIAVKEIGL